MKQLDIELVLNNLVYFDNYHVDDNCLFFDNHLRYHHHHYNYHVIVDDNHLFYLNVDNFDLVFDNKKKLIVFDYNMMDLFEQVIPNLNHFNVKKKFSSYVLNIFF